MALLATIFVLGQDRFETTGITSRIESALAFTGSQSSVDVSKISFNTFLIAYGDQLKKIGFTDQQIEEYIDYSEKVFNRLKGGGTEAALEGHPLLDYRVPQLLSPFFADQFPPPGRARWHALVTVGAWPADGHFQTYQRQSAS